MARWYIGGLLAHARSVVAFANPTTNSYKRLVPGYEAPVNLVYCQRNRSASVRIPLYSQSPKAKRLEFRCPDPSCNPYLAFSAMLMAGLDGIQNRIEPPAPVDKDLYDLPPEELAKVPQVPASLDEALDALEADQDFLKAGGVFTDDLIETWIDVQAHERGRRHSACVRTPTSSRSTTTSEPEGVADLPIRCQPSSVGPQLVLSWSSVGPQLVLSPASEGSVDGLPGAVLLVPQSALLGIVNVQAVVNQEAVVSGASDTKDRGFPFLGDLLSGFLDALQGTAATGRSDRTDIAYKVGAIGWPDGGIPGRGLEIGVHPSHAFTFLQTQLLDDLLAPAMTKPLVGYISVRVCPKTETVMGMQQFDPSVMIEIVGYRSPDANEIMDAIQQRVLDLNRTRRLRAVLHWGLENDKMTAVDLVEHSVERSLRFCSRATSRRSRPCAPSSRLATHLSSITCSRLG